MTTVFELRTDRPDKAGACALRLVVYFDAHRLRLPTKERSLSKDWDLAGQRLRRSFPVYAAANDALRAQADRVALVSGVW